MRLDLLPIIGSVILAALFAGQFPAIAAPAAKEAGRFQLVGFTAATFSGGQGVLGFTLACQDEFPGSRMCTSLEVMETTELPLLPGTGDAWVRPSFVPSGSVEAADASGRSGTFRTLTCSGWNGGASTSDHGLGVSVAGKFLTPVCFLELSVTCCAPVP